MTKKEIGEIKDEAFALSFFLLHFILPSQSLIFSPTLCPYTLSRVNFPSVSFFPSFPFLVSYSPSLFIFLNLSITKFLQKYTYHSSSVTFSLSFATPHPTVPSSFNSIFLPYSFRH